MEVCQFGDKEIDNELSKVYNKNKNMEKGLAFPTCISPNEICGNFSPMKDESLEIKEGDLLKIDVGAHIDGYIAVGGQTICV